MKASPAPRRLFPVIALMLMVFFPVMGWAEDPGVGLSQRMLCYTYAVFDGNVGLLVGFCIATFGLWTVIKGSAKAGILLILAGALVPVAPSLVSATLSGAQAAMGGISQAKKDAGTVMQSMGEFKGNCDAIPVDMSAYEQKLMNTPGVVKNADGTYTITNTDGSTVTAVNAAQAMDYLGQVVGTGQCVALLQAADPSIGNTATWKPGAAVVGNADLQPGTMIALFGCNGGTSYCNQAGNDSSHAAIYLGQDANGNIQVLDQWAGQPAHIRTIRANGSGNVNNSSGYRVISH